MPSLTQRKTSPKCLCAVLLAAVLLASCNKAPTLPLCKIKPAPQRPYSQALLEGEALYGQAILAYEQGYLHKAVEFSKEACDLGLASACFSLGMFYSGSRGAKGARGSTPIKIERSDVCYESFKSSDGKDADYELGTKGGVKLGF